jgi:streptogramin lyase
VVAASVPVGGKPEFAQVDGKGHVFFNLEDKNEIGEIDAKTGTVTKHYSIAPCDGPSGLAYDAKSGHLFSVCENKMMIVSDPAAGKVLAMPAIGAGPDGVAFDDGYAFSANGRDGNITMVGMVNGKYDDVATIETQKLARTIGADQKAHKLYLPTADSGPMVTPPGGGRARAQAVPDSFGILVVARQ